MGFIDSYKKKKEIEELERMFNQVVGSSKIKKPVVNVKTNLGSYLSFNTGRVHLIKPAKYSPITEYSNPKKESEISNERIDSGVHSLDPIMGGGFRKNTVNLIGGGTGSGKSIFCMQYLAHGIDHSGENGIYLSFEENKEKILQDFKVFNWDLDKKIKNK